MAQWLGVPVALPEDPGPVPSTRVRWLSTTCNASSRDLMPSSGFLGQSFRFLLDIQTPSWVYMHACALHLYGLPLPQKPTRMYRCVQDMQPQVSQTLKETGAAVH